MANLKYKHTAYTSAQWASLNPVIVENEIVIESDTKRTKIGNGISTYNQLEYADANSVGNSLGSIKPTDAAPTPQRNGNYTFSIGGNKPAWLTAEAGVTTVKAGDGVSVVYDGVSAYTYTHVNMSSAFVTIQKLAELGYMFKGVAIPTTVPGTPDGNVYYIIEEKGTYTNFSGLTHDGLTIAIMSWNGIWTKTNYSISQLNLKKNTINKIIISPGKNLFDKTDTSIISGSYLNGSGNVISGDAASSITPFIPIAAGQSLYCNTGRNSSPYAAVLYDSNYNKLTVTPQTKTVTANVDGYARFTIIDTSGTYSLTQIENGTAGTTYEAYTPITLGTSGIKDAAVTGEKIADAAVTGEKIAKNTIAASNCNFISPNKNLFDKNDTSIISGSYLNGSGNVISGDAASSITPFIPIAAGQSLYCNTGRNSSPYAAVLYDSNYNKLTVTPQTKTVTANVNGYVRFTIIDTSGTYSLTQVENGTAGTTYEGYQLKVKKEYIPDLNSITVTEITVKKNGTIGVDCQFTDLKAAFDSITDATEKNRYKIVFEGQFIATTPNEVQMVDQAYPDEFSVVVGKDWVDLEGLDKEKSMIGILFPDDTVFPDGKTFNDYQPIMWNCHATGKNFGVVGLNCRYALHLEGGTFVTNETLTFENVRFEHKGNAGVGASNVHCIGTGMRDGQTWNFNRCDFINTMATAFGLHTALSTVKRGGTINCIDSTFDCKNIYAANYPSNRHVFFNIISPIFKKGMYVSYTGNYFNSSSKQANYADIKFRISKPILFSNNEMTKGGGLRIISKTTGSNSSVRFDETCSAFDYICGDSAKIGDFLTDRNTNQTFGYDYKDGAGTLKGYAVGGIDVDENNTAKSVGLGIALGDCSVVSKTLTVIIDGTSYNVVFSENLIAKNNAYVIALINAIIGSYADIDVYQIGREYYPELDGLKRIINSTTDTILSGMGVVFTGDDTMRIATNADGYIDGVCIDDCGQTQFGRVLTKECKLYSYYAGSSQRFRVLDVSNLSVPFGDSLGISVSQPGYFDRTSTPKLIKAFKTDALVIK